MSGYCVIRSSCRLPLSSDLPARGRGPGSSSWLVRVALEERDEAVLSQQQAVGARCGQRHRHEALLVASQLSGSHHRIAVDGGRADPERATSRPTAGPSAHRGWRWLTVLGIGGSPRAGLGLLATERLRPAGGSLGEAHPRWFQSYGRDWLHPAFCGCEHRSCGRHREQAPRPLSGLRGGGGAGALP